MLRWWHFLSDGRCEMTAKIEHLGVARVVAQLREMSSDPVLTSQEKLQIGAAICCLVGDLAGVEQTLAASRIDPVLWEAAKKGQLDYDDV